MEKKEVNQKHIKELCIFLAPHLKEVSKRAVEQHFSVLDMMKVAAFVFLFLIYPPREELEVYIAVLEHVIKESNEAYFAELKKMKKEDGTNG